MNPPYQGDIKNNGDIARRVVISTLWDKFVRLGLKIVNEDGALIAIHPSQYRMGKKKFKDIWDTFVSNQIHYLEMHDCNDGLKTFKALTRYDWYILQKTKRYKDTEICFEDGVLTDLDISQYPVIPNSSDQIELFKKIVCKKDDEPIKFIHSNVFYKHDKPHMSKNKDSSHIYPCVKHTSKCSPVSIRWSNKNIGHFGDMKVIYGNQADVGKIILDLDGKYGLTQFVSGIGAKSKKELTNIYNAIVSDKFYEFMKAFQTGRVMFNNDIISCLRKDFWKEFI